MQHCALAPIQGKGGMAGGIMSHDFVEAALMRRAGYQVWLVSDLTGSYEQQPPDLLSELQRDRRWCQGNLQNARLIAEPGLHRVHRAMFAIGAMSYLSAPLWLAFLTLRHRAVDVGRRRGARLAGAAGGAAQPVGLDPLHAVHAAPAGVAAVFLQRDQQALRRRRPRCWAAPRLETVLALLQAPIRMLAHSLFVLVALTGLKLDWKSPPREAAGVTWRDAAARLAPMTIVIGLHALAIAAIQAGALIWLAPVALPLLLAVPLAVLTSQVGAGRWMRSAGVLLIPEESRSPAVLRRAWRHAGAAALSY